MKKILCFVVMALTVSFTYSQIRESFQGSTIKLLESNAAKDGEPDTLRPSSMYSGTSYTLQALKDTFSTDPLVTDTGFVFGTNRYNDRAKAQLYMNDSEEYDIIGGFAMVGRAYGTGDIYFRIYDCDSMGVAANSDYTYREWTTAPGTILGSKKIDLSDIPETNYLADNTDFVNYMFSFDTPIRVDKDFYLGVDFDSIVYPGNEFGLISTISGVSQNQSWELSKNVSKWSSASYVYRLDVDVIICPIVNVVTSVQENFINGVIMNIFPNPVTDNATISYELKNSMSKVNFYILDVNGQEVMNINLGAQNAGANSVSVNLSELPSGNYFYAVQADGSRFAKPFVK